MSLAQSSGLNKLFRDLQVSTACVQKNCSRANNESIQKVKQQLEKDVFALALSHNEVIELQRLAMSTDPDTGLLIQKFVSLLEKPGFRSDIAAIIDKYNEQLLKPSAEKERLLQEIQCFKENKCSIEDLQKIAMIAKAVVDFGLDPKISRSWAGVLKSQSKTYSMFLKLTGQK